MASLYNKIRRLKQQPGWSWEHFQSEINSIDTNGIKLKLLQRYHRSPHKKPTPRITEIIELLHNECFPSPFPEPVDRLMRVYRELKTCSRYLTKDKDTRDLEAHVEQRLTALEEADHLSKACLQWLLGNIEFDRIDSCLDSGELAQLEIIKQRAIGHYQSVISALEAHNRLHPQRAVSVLHLYQAHHNMLACYLHAVPDEKRHHDAVMLQYLRDSDYLARCKAAVAAEPFQWSIVRNGLRFSSLLKDEAEVKHFFSLLTAIHPKFVDLSYEPFNQLSISVMPAYQWAIKNVLTPHYLDETSKELKSQARNNKQQNAA